VPVRELALAAAVFLVDCIALWLTRAANGVALFWPGCAIAACALIRFRRVRWVWAALTLILAVWLANILAGHRAPALSFAFAALNLTEVALMVGAFRFLWVYPYPDISVEQAAIMTAVLGIAVPGLSALLGDLIVGLFFRPASSVVVLEAWSSHAMGACLLGPPLILASAERLRRLVRARFLVENVLALVLSLTGAYLCIRYVHFPFVTISLFLLLASFRLGGFGTSLLSLAAGFLVGNLWVLGIRPVGLEHVPVTGTLVDLPVVAFLAALMPPVAVGIGNDARRAAARALQASERHFRESMENSPIGTLIADLDGRWTHTNRVLQAMLGYSDAELRALPPGGPSDPKEWQASEARWGRLLTGDVSSYQIDRRFRHKDGHWIWTHVAVSLTRDQQERPLNLIAQIESLDERRSAEAKLAAERERLRVTLSAIADAVVTTDMDSQIQYVNPAAERLLGIPEDAALGRRIGDVIHLVNPETQRRAPSLILQSTMHGTAVRRDRPCLLHRSDGTICYILDSISPVLGEAGQVTGLVMVLHDATGEVERTRDLEVRASQDRVTGLANRSEFELRLRKCFDRARHLGVPAALVAIDLDRFKAVNDTGGHAVGDEMLKKVAATCHLQVRSSDTLARLGGDEFAIILDNCTAERAQVIGAQLLRVLNPLALERNGVSFVIGASIGIAMIHTHTASPEDWLKAADSACYRAKQAGRGMLEFDRG
jgi:diguanylate cyclase (GGDEF)-like protein/PAS domain S-box-containing protein